MAKYTTAKSAAPKSVEALKHVDDKRRNIPTAEFQAVLDAADQAPLAVAYARRNRDLDPQLVWRGKDVADWSDLVVHAPPLYIQEKIHPKVLIDDLMRQTAAGRAQSPDAQLDLFGDFNGLPSEEARTEFYRHDQNWTNRMILGDSLQVMASLAEREGLRGKVQCIYFDPPYGIKFNSNFQWSTTSRDVKDGNTSHITREPEQVKAFRDTWRDGIHSYLTYLRDRLTTARDLLHESGSLFVQIGDENVHRVRALLEEVFGEDNVVSQIAFKTTTGRASDLLAASSNYLIWATRDVSKCKYRPVFQEKSAGASTEQVYSLARDSSGASWRISRTQRLDLSKIPVGTRIFRADNLTSSRPASGTDVQSFEYCGCTYKPGKGTFKTEIVGLTRLARADRLWPTSQGTIQYIRFLDDFPVIPFSNVWIDTGTGSFTEDKVYVVQTNTKVIERCLLMTTDPGDLVLDPTCGSGTTAYVAEQWGRRWITIDTSRVALALARARLMGARYPYYLLADSREGQLKEADITRTPPSSQPVAGNLRHGFVYERVPHITLKSIANNTEIDVIWDKWQATLEPLRQGLNAARGQNWQEWELPRRPEDPWPEAAAAAWGEIKAEQGRGDDANPKKVAVALQTISRTLGRTYTLTDLPDHPADSWPPAHQDLHAAWWQARIARQKEIDASIAAKAEFEYLYDRPYEDRKHVRVAGPFTVESLSPHRVLGVDEDDDLIDPLKEGSPAYGEGQSFVQMILENLKTSGVQQAHKDDRISFSSLTPWPGDLICAEGRYAEEGTGLTRRAGIMIGPEFGTVTRPDLVAAAREAGDAAFDVLIACAFNYEAHTTEFSKLGRIPVLKARMNADLHMAGDLKNTGKGNLFVIFGEPDIDILRVGGNTAAGDIQVRINGVDVFHPNTGEVRSDGPDAIACWFIDTDYNEEGFFVRQAYFLGANDPYGALKTTLKAEIDEDAWASLNRAVSRPFPKPASGRIAVKVINHLGDEVMKVFKVN
jgi:adenine-specific DNA-methyltransferase